MNYRRERKRFGFSRLLRNKLKCIKVYHADCGQYWAVLPPYYLDTRQVSVYDSMMNEPVLYSVLLGLFKRFGTKSVMLTGKCSHR